MKVRRLKLKEIKDIYRKYMIHDFPYEERRPFTRIAKYFREGRYEGYGGFDEDGQLLCYAMFLVYKEGKNLYCLFDYLAVMKTARDTGIGSAFLKHLGTCFPHTACVFGEVENPAFAEDDTDLQTRTRRMDFYRRNGLRDTGVEACVFGVDYRILEIPLSDNAEWYARTPAEILSICEKTYRSVFPGYFYNRFVELRIPT